MYGNIFNMFNEDFFNTEMSVACLKVIVNF